MAPDVIAAIIAGVLALVGLIGIVVPVLPGSITILAGFLIWAIFGGTAPGWILFAAGAVLLVIGMVFGWLLTGRGLQRKRIPSTSVLVGLGAGVVGIFVLPALGLPIGFAAGLVVAEYVRVRDVRTALDSSWTAVKALGLGMAVELLSALVAATLLAFSIFVHFVWF